ncbi:MAG: AraC family transcriptional regulator [Bacteroidota bacterium]
MQELLDQISIRHDLNSTLMMCGILQGMLLSVLLFMRTSKQQQPLRMLAFFALLVTLISIDVYLCYTGIMKYVLWLNDTTEVLVILLGPLLYFFLLGALNKEVIRFQSSWIHFLLPALYLLSQLGYYFQEEAVKLNAYIAAFHPHSARPPFELSPMLLFSERIQDYWRFIILFSYAIYLPLCIRIVWKYSQSKSTTSSTFKFNRLLFSKNILFIMLAVVGVATAVYINNKADLGDHFIILTAGACQYLVSFILMSESQFFGNSWLADKYDTSGLKYPPSDLLHRIQTFLQQEQYYLQTDCQLKDLATQLGVPPNYISQAINGQLQINFNEFINRFRVEEAQKRLLSEDYAHLSIAGISESVGFKSKSAFYAAFKKEVAMTPAQYVKVANTRKNTTAN